MEDSVVNDQPVEKTVPQRPNHKKKRQTQYSNKIVYSMGNYMQTLPCLREQVKKIRETIIGLNYVWEYRSPSNTVRPHYQCKLCSVSGLQSEMIAHVKGWKHYFKYLLKCHPDKVKWQEEQALMDSQARKEIKSTAAEVEKMEGKGEVKVVMKEPAHVLAFQGCDTAKQKLPRGMKHMEPPFNPQIHGPSPHHGEPFSGPVDEYSQPSFGMFPPRSDFPDSGNNQRPFMGGMEDHSSMGGTSGFAGGEHEENDGNFMGGQTDGPMNSPTERPGLPEGSSQSLSSTLLTYLDTFQIENEDDAQMVLKVTQKLTDVLMNYRLWSVNKVSSPSNMSMRNSNFSQPPSRFPGGGNQYSGPSRYSDGPSRFNR